MSWTPKDGFCEFEDISHKKYKYLNTAKEGNGNYDPLEPKMLNSIQRDDCKTEKASRIPKQWHKGKDKKNGFREPNSR